MRIWTLCEGSKEEGVKWIYYWYKICLISARMQRCGQIPVQFRGGATRFAKLFCMLYFYRLFYLIIDISDSLTAPCRMKQQPSFYVSSNGPRFSTQHVSRKAFFRRLYLTLAKLKSECSYCIMLCVVLKSLSSSGFLTMMHTE